MGWVDRIRARVPFKMPLQPYPDTPPVLDTFKSGLSYGVNAVTPYRPKVTAKDFPSIPIAGKKFMPPSLQPQMVIRRGGTPAAPTVPEGSIHAHGSK
jgi:hypothetical protein